MSLKILYVITGLGLGGAEVQVCKLADKFMDKGNEVKIAYLFGNISVRPENESIELISLKLTRNPISLFFSIFNLIKLISHFNPDVMHSHMWHANILSRIVRPFTKVNKLVCSAHSSNEGGRFRMMLYRLTNPLCETFTNVGRASVENYIRMKAAKENNIFPVVNGIDVDIFRPDDSNNDWLKDTYDISYNKRIFLAVGRSHKAKDYPNMLEAFSILKRDDYHLFIAGKGTEEFQDLVSKLGLNDNITILGQRSDVKELMQGSDILVVSSEREGLPMVIGEAMSCGCNIVTTNAGSCEDYLTDLESAVKCKNSAYLANALENKLNLDKNEMRYISCMNREKIINFFSINYVISMWESIYND